LDFRTDKFRQIMPTLFILGIIFLLLHLASITDVLSIISKPMVVFVVKLVGINAVDQGNFLLLGKLMLPWTEDCSGINSLVMLLGISLWVNRQNIISWPSLLRLMLCMPAALLANLLRVLTFAFYRYTLYPSWESQELHYFIGFMWLLPFLVLFVPDFRHKNRNEWLEIFYMAVLLAMIAPTVFSPGGSLVTICSLFYLAHNRMEAADLPQKKILYVFWVISAFLIAWSRMESLWIPWLLLCPRFVASQILLSWKGIIILLGTISLLALHTTWQIIVMVTILIYGYGIIKSERVNYNSFSTTVKIPEFLALIILLLSPFLLQDLIGIRYKIERPPPGVMKQQLSFNSYKIRVAGQPSDISMYWYGAFNEGRHHSLPACMRFKGIILKEVENIDNIYFGNQKWMQEFFIHDKILKSSYSEYLLSSFSPFAKPGVHIIFEAPSKTMSPAYFAQESKRIAAHLYKIYVEAH